jgi:hypothetical protein
VTPDDYGTRWRLAAPVLAGALAGVAGLGVALAHGALALSFVAQSGTLDLTTAGLTGTDFGVVAASVPVSGGSAPAARIGVGSAHINGLCLAQHTTVLGQPVTILISGGDTDPSTFEISATGLLLDVTGVQGAIATGGELAVNKSAADVALGSSGVSLGGAADRFGLQASSVSLRGVRATVRDIVVPNLLQVPNFAVRVLAGAQSCPTVSAPDMSGKH